MSSDVQAKLGRALLKSLVDLRENKGEISLQDVGAMFIQMASTVNPAVSPADQFLHEEIARLAEYIGSAKKEIFAISTNEKEEAVISNASQHLDEVIKATEQASNAIMDAADKIQTAVKGIGGDKEKDITAATVELYNACNFQDITGQRINKVIKLLENIDERIMKLNGLFGSTAAANGNGAVIAGTNPQDIVVPVDEKELLNGPQLSGQASSQAEIDALFASLGAKK